MFAHNTTSSPDVSRFEASGLLGDDEIKHLSEDLFDVKQFALTLASAIAEAPASRGFVIGVNGKWGCGKSSFIELVRDIVGAGGQKIDDTGDAGVFRSPGTTYDPSDIVRRVRAVQRKNIHLIDFDPWRLTTDANTMQELLALLHKKVERSIKEHAVWFGTRVLKAAGNSVGTFFQVSAATDLVFGENDADTWLSDDYKQLREKLASYRDCRFLIVLDNLDRLEEEEIRRVVRMVKALRRLPNTVFLLVFDETIVAKALAAGEDVAHGRQFLEKIVQVSFDLPRPTMQALRNGLETQIEMATRRALALPAHRARDGVGRADHWAMLFERFVAPHLQTPRAVRRLANAAILTWNMAPDGALDIRDHVAVQAIRIFNPVLYDWLFEHRHELTKPPAAHRDIPGPDLKFASDIAACFPLFPRRLQRLAKETLDDAALGAQLRDRKSVGHDYYTESYFRYVSSTQDTVVYRMLDLARGDLSDDEAQEIVRQAARTQKSVDYVSAVLGYLDDLTNDTARVAFAERVAQSTAGLKTLIDEHARVDARGLVEALTEAFQTNFPQDADRLIDLLSPAQAGLR